MLLKAKVAAFDMDGTMIDSMASWWGVYREFLDERGLEMPEELRPLTRAQRAPRPACTAIERAYGEQLGMTWDDIWGCFLEGVRRHYATDVELKPGIHEYLDALRAQGVRVGVATATPEPLARVAMERLGLAQRMDFAYYAGMSKAEPGYFERLAREQGAAPEECVMFEDAAYSMRAAKAAGFQVYAVEDEIAARDREEILSLSDRYFIDYFELLNGEENN